MSLHTIFVVEGTNVGAQCSVMLVLFVTLAWYVELGPFVCWTRRILCWARPIDQEGLGLLYVTYVLTIFVTFAFS